MNRCTLFRIIIAMIIVTLAGTVDAADSCTKKTSRLVYAGGETPKLFTWPNENVELVCRPATNSSCRWFFDGNIIGEDCSMLTSQTGIIKCMHADEKLGTISLANPYEQQIQRKGYSSRWSRSRYNQWQGKFTDFPTYLCPSSGQIIDERYVCDGEGHCTNNEDEANCGLDSPCGSPAVRQHSHLLMPVESLYPHNANVSYACDSGFFFKDAINTSVRTCKNGQWNPTLAPNCHRNLVAAQPTSVTGHVISKMAQEAVVDGRLDTWFVMAPGQHVQSIKILSDQQRPSQILMIADSQYEVLLQSNTSAEACSCSPAASNQRSSPVKRAEFIKCDCTDAKFEKLEPPLDIVIRTEASSFTAVAEVVALDTNMDQETDYCELLDLPAHGRYEHVNNSTVKLICDPGFSIQCDEPEERVCQSSDTLALCEPITCPSPPTIPRATLVSQNGTSWSAEAQYACDPGFIVFPVDQPTTAVCGDDGTWSFGHLSCVAEIDVRVITWTLAQQHQKSVEALRVEIETLAAGQLLMLNQLKSNQQQLNITQKQLHRTQQQVNNTREELQATQKQLQDQLVMEQAELITQQGERARGLVSLGLVDDVMMADSHSSGDGIPESATPTDEVPEYLS